MVIRALRAIAVPVLVIADFDVLNEETVLSGLVEAAGSDWAELRDLWKTPVDAIAARVGVGLIAMTGYVLPQRPSRARIRSMHSHTRSEETKTDEGSRRFLWKLRTEPT